jgi:hypothetical protein
MLCIVLSIIWVKFTIPAVDYYSFQSLNIGSPSGGSSGGGFGGGVPSSGPRSNETPSSDEFSESLRLALIIMGQIIGGVIESLILSDHYHSFAVQVWMYENPIRDFRIYCSFITWTLWLPLIISASGIKPPANSSLHLIFHWTI